MRTTGCGENGTGLTGAAGHRNWLVAPRRVPSPCGGVVTQNQWEPGTQLRDGAAVRTLTTTASAMAAAAEAGDC